jgi:hypothetical protein
MSGFKTQGVQIGKENVRAEARTTRNRFTHILKFDRSQSQIFGESWYSSKCCCEKRFLWYCGWWGQGGG